MNSIEELNGIFKDIRKYSNNTFIIQIEGDVLNDQELLKALSEDLASLQSIGITLVLIHDGSNIVNNIIDKYSDSKIQNSLYNFDHGNAEAVEMILSGLVNKKIVTQINQAGGNAVGISGKDGQFMLARRSRIARYDFGDNNKVLNFGFIGELALVNPEILFALEESNLLPVISPITLGDDGRTYKIDPHDISATLAAVLGANKVIFISNLVGIKDENNEVIENIQSNQIAKILSTIDDNDLDLTSKLRTSMMVLEHNPSTIHILDGKIKHSLMLQLFTEANVGTTIQDNNQANS